MHKIFSSIATWFAGLFAVDPPADPLSRMSPRELADLPVHHPSYDQCAAS